MSSRVPDKLAQDAMAACAAGMSYGKWKALQGANKANEGAHAAQTGKRCAWCGCLMPEDTRKICCSEECRRKRHAERCRLAYHQKKTTAADGERGDRIEQETA